MSDLNRALECRSDAESFGHLLRAAEGGCVRAQALVGIAYHIGRGVESDFERAAGWYRKAAGRGDSYAMANLGVLSVLGQGSAADDVEAYTWLQSAAGLGHAGFRPVLSLLERRIVGGCAGDASGVLASVSPLTPTLRRCTRPKCDPSRCDAS